MAAAMMLCWRRFVEAPATTIATTTATTTATTATTAATLVVADDVFSCDFESFDEVLWLYSNGFHLKISFCWC